MEDVSRKQKFGSSFGKLNTSFEQADSSAEGTIKLGSAGTLAAIPSKTESSLMDTPLTSRGKAVEDLAADKILEINQKSDDHSLNDVEEPPQPMPQPIPLDLSKQT